LGIVTPGPDEDGSKCQSLNFKHGEILSKSANRSIFENLVRLKPYLNR